MNISVENGSLNENHLKIFEIETENVGYFCFMSRYNRFCEDIFISIIKSNGPKAVWICWQSRNSYNFLKKSPMWTFLCLIRTMAMILFSVSSIYLITIAATVSTIIMMNPNGMNCSFKIDTPKIKEKTGSKSPKIETEFSKAKFDDPQVPSK
mgnify:CR=1 FL=1